MTHANVVPAASTPNARLCQPREEHLLPLMFAVSDGDDMRTNSDTMMGKVLSRFRFG